MNRFQVMDIATAIAKQEEFVFGDSLAMTKLTEIIRDRADALRTWDTPVEVLKRAEDALVDVVNLLDQANDRYKTTTDLGKEADRLLAGVQKLIEYMTREPEPADVD